MYQMIAKVGRDTLQYCGKPRQFDLSTATVHSSYFGDFSPSGSAMTRHRCKAVLGTDTVSEPGRDAASPSCSHLDRSGSGVLRPAPHPAAVPEPSPSSASSPAAARTLTSAPTENRGQAAMGRGRDAAPPASSASTGQELMLHR